MPFQTSFLSLNLATFTEEFAIAGTHSSYPKSGVHASQTQLCKPNFQFSALTFVAKFPSFD